MTSDFERATEVLIAGEGRYESQVADDWDIAGNANGGYLMAVAARAMGDAVGRPPLSLTAHFVSPGLVGPVTVDVEVVRSGRRMAVVRGTLRTEKGQPVLALIGTSPTRRPITSSRAHPSSRSSSCHRPTSAFAADRRCRWAGSRSRS